MVDVVGGDLFVRWFVGREFPDGGLAVWRSIKSSVAGDGALDVSIIAAQSGCSDAYVRRVLAGLLVEGVVSSVHEGQARVWRLLPSRASALDGVSESRPGHAH